MNKLALRYYELSKLTTIYENKKIIDCACGRGFGSLLILEKFKPEIFVCVDISKKAINECKIKTKDKAIYVCKDLKILEYDNKFDYFFCVETLEHLPEEYNLKIAKIISNLIKDDGKLLISVPGNKKDAMNCPEHLQIVTKNTLLDMFNDFILENEGIFIKRKKEPDSYNSLYVLCKKVN